MNHTQSQSRTFKRPTSFKQSLKSNRSGKIVFQFEPTDVAGISKQPETFVTKGGKL